MIALVRKEKTHSATPHDIDNVYDNDDRNRNCFYCAERLYTNIAHHSTHS
jgi:hypothetical protein